MSIEKTNNEQSSQLPSKPTPKQRYTLFQCDICKKRFKLKSTLREHIDNFHNPGLPFRCELCDYKFSVQKLFIGHIRGHLDGKPYACEVEGCEERFKTAAILKIHKREHTKGVRKKPNQQKDKVPKILPKKVLDTTPSQENVTGIEVKKTEQLNKQEILTNTRLPELNFKASPSVIVLKNNFCTKNLYDTNRDVEDHETEGIFSCDLCKVDFKTENEVKDHIRQKQCQKPTCKICNRSFSNVKSLKAHYNCHFAKNVDQNVNAKFGCAVCKIKFKTEEGIEFHVKQGQCNALIPCNFCSKEFVNLTFLQKHLRIHIHEDQNTENVSQINKKMGSASSSSQEISASKDNQSLERKKTVPSVPNLQDISASKDNQSLKRKRTVSTESNSSIISAVDFQSSKCKKMDINKGDLKDASISNDSECAKRKKMVSTKTDSQKASSFKDSRSDNLETVPMDSNSSLISTDNSQSSKRKKIDINKCDTEDVSISNDSQCIKRKKIVSTKTDSQKASSPKDSRSVNETAPTESNSSKISAIDSQSSERKNTVNNKRDLDDVSFSNDSERVKRKKMVSTVPGSQKASASKGFWSVNLETEISASIDSHCKKRKIPASTKRDLQDVPTSNDSQCKKCKKTDSTTESSLKPNSSQDSQSIKCKKMVPAVLSSQVNSASKKSRPFSKKQVIKDLMEDKESQDHSSGELKESTKKVKVDSVSKNKSKKDIRDRVNKRSQDVTTRAKVDAEVDKDTVEVNRGNRRRYQCKQCPKRFEDSFHFRNHLVTHSEVRPFSCKVCNLSFKREDHLKRHVKNLEH